MWFSSTALQGHPGLNLVFDVLALQDHSQCKNDTHWVSGWGSLLEKSSCCRNYCRKEWIIINAYSHEKSCPKTRFVLRFHILISLLWYLQRLVQNVGLPFFLFAHTILHFSMKHLHASGSLSYQCYFSMRVPLLYTHSGSKRHQPHKTSILFSWRHTFPRFIRYSFSSLFYFNYFTFLSYILYIIQ